MSVLKSKKTLDLYNKRSLTYFFSFRKRSDSYFLPTQTQSILDETEEWLKEQSVLSEIIHNSENTSGNARIPNGNSLHGSLSDVTGGAEWDVTYKDSDLATGIDQYNGTSV